MSDKSRVLSLRRGRDPKLCLVGATLTHILGVESEVQRILVAQVYMVLLPGGDTQGSGTLENSSPSQTMGPNDNNIIDTIH